MLKFGVNNLRRLIEVQPVEIKPITILLGRNSGGKSTFLRTFPLFRQSLITRTSSPILWYGDLVDFGSFDTSISRGQKSRAISFTFVIDKLAVSSRPTYFVEEFESIRQQRWDRSLNNIVYTVNIEKKGERTRISSIQFQIGSFDIDVNIKVEDSGFIGIFSVNGKDLIPLIQPTRMFMSSGTLFPDLRTIRSKDETKHDAWISASLAPAYNILFKLLRRVIDRRIRDKTINSLSMKLLTSGLPTREKVIEIGTAHGKAVGKTFANLAENNTEIFEQVMELMYIVEIPNVFRSASLHLKTIMSSTLYIGPARARSERYYRYQDLAVSEIDPDGKNFPMFLNSLQRKQMENFSAWVKSLFGYGVSVSGQTGHISINLIDDGVETNIVDVGYGVSQILPVLGQIWWARERNVSRENRSALALLAIEQPELHLHPAHQALLADALVGEATATLADRSETARMHYLVETHSETLVNRLGEFISAGKLNPDDVQVLLFEPDAEQSRTTVKTVRFDEHGALVNWPYGFFQPSVSMA